MRVFFKKKSNPTIDLLKKEKNLSNIRELADQIHSKEPVITYRYKDDVIKIINEQASLYHIVHTTSKMEKLAEACMIIDEGVMLDIGANIGLFTYFYKKRNPNVQSYLFEPDKRLIPIINANLSSFGNFEIINKAVGEKNEVIDFYVNPQSSQTNSFLIESITPFLNKNDILFIKIESINLKDFCLQKKINTINTLKIDIQGSEFPVLSASEQVLDITQEAIIEICFLMPNTIPLIKLVDKHFQKSAPITEIIMGADIKFFK
jgi:FkbM family methyltransferase